MSENSSYLANAQPQRGQQQPRAKKLFAQQVHQQTLASIQSLAESSTNGDSLCGILSQPTRYQQFAPEPLVSSGQEASASGLTDVAQRRDGQNGTTTPGSAGCKPKQPYLQRGSGLKSRVAAAKQRRYVPKGGFVLTFDSDSADATDAASSQSSAAAPVPPSSHQPDKVSVSRHADRHGSSAWDAELEQTGSPWRINAYAADLAEQPGPRSVGSQSTAATGHRLLPSGLHRNQPADLKLQNLEAFSAAAADSPMAGTSTHNNPLAASDASAAQDDCGLAANGVESCNDGWELDSDTTLVNIPDGKAATDGAAWHSQPLSTPSHGGGPSPVPPGSRMRSTADWIAMKAEEELELEEFRALERQIGCELGDPRSSLRLSRGAQRQAGHPDRPASCAAGPSAVQQDGRPGTENGQALSAPPQSNGSAETRACVSSAQVVHAAIPLGRAAAVEHTSHPAEPSGDMQHGLPADTSNRYALAAQHDASSITASACAPGPDACQPLPPAVPLWAAGNAAVEFDDQAEWDSASVSFARSTGTETGTPLRKSRAGGLRKSKGQAEEGAEHAAPTSMLVQQLFHQHQARNGATGQQTAGSDHNTGDAAPQQQVPAADAERMAALDAEVERFRAERAKVDWLKTQLEHAIGRMEQEKVAFERRKAEEAAAWAAAREEEEARLKRERRVLEKQSRALLKLPNRKERSEVEALEAVLEQERKGGKAREARHKLTVERLRRQIVELQDKNTELREEVRWHEAQRLKQWEGTPASTTKPASAAKSLTSAKPASSAPRDAAAPADLDSRQGMSARAVTGPAEGHEDGEVQSQVPLSQDSSQVQAQHSMADMPGTHAQQMLAPGWHVPPEVASGGSCAAQHAQHLQHAAGDDAMHNHSYDPSPPQPETVTQQAHAGPASLPSRDQRMDGRPHQGGQWPPNLELLSSHMAYVNASNSERQWVPDPTQIINDGHTSAHLRNGRESDLGPALERDAVPGTSAGMTLTAGGQQRPGWPQQWNINSLLPPTDSLMSAFTATAELDGQLNGTGSTSLAVPAHAQDAGRSSQLWTDASLRSSIHMPVADQDAGSDALSTSGAIQHSSQADYGRQPGGGVPPHAGLRQSALSSGGLPHTAQQALRHSTAYGQHADDISPPGRPQWPDWTRSHDADSMQWASPTQPLQDRMPGGVACRRITGAGVVVSPGRVPLRSVNGTRPQVHGQEHPPAGYSQPQGLHGHGAAHQMAERVQAHTGNSAIVIQPNANHCASTADVQHEVHASIVSQQPAETHTSLAELLRAARVVTAAPSQPQARQSSSAQAMGSDWDAAAYVDGAAPDGPDTRASALSGASLAAFERQLVEYETGVLGTAGRTQQQSDQAAYEVALRWQSAAPSTIHAAAMPDLHAGRGKPATQLMQEHGLDGRSHPQAHATPQQQQQQHGPYLEAQRAHSQASQPPHTTAVRTGHPGSAADLAGRHPSEGRAQELLGDVSDLRAQSRQAGMRLHPSEQAGPQAPAVAARGMGPSSGAGQPEGPNGSCAKEVQYADGKTERVYADGRRSITFANGTVKEHLPDGRSAIRFTNGDIKKMLPSGRVEYYYAEVDTWQTTYSGGVEVFYFPNGQTEAHHPGGMKEILFPDRVIRRVYPDGREQDASHAQLSHEVKQPRPRADLC